MSMFKKYLNVVTESKNSDSENITRLITTLKNDNDLMEEFKTFDDFDDFDSNASIELRQVVNPIRNSSYHLKNDFQELKKFIYENE